MESEKREKSSEEGVGIVGERGSGGVDGKRKNEPSFATLKDNPIKCFLLLGDDLRPSSVSSKNISQLRQNTHTVWHNVTITLYKIHRV